MDMGLYIGTLFSKSFNHAFTQLKKWGLKVCLAYSTSKYVWNFEVYCRKKNILLVTMENVDENLALARYSEPRLVHNVVSKMVEGLLLMGHNRVMDNFFQA